MYNKILTIFVHFQNFMDEKCSLNVQAGLRNLNPSPVSRSTRALGLQVRCSFYVTSAVTPRDATIRFVTNVQPVGLYLAWNILRILARDYRVLPTSRSTRDVATTQLIQEKEDITGISCENYNWY